MQKGEYTNAPPHFLRIPQLSTYFLLEFCVGIGHFSAGDAGLFGEDRLVGFIQYLSVKSCHNIFRPIIQSYLSIFVADYVLFQSRSWAFLLEGVSILMGYCNSYRNENITTL